MTNIAQLREDTASEVYSLLVSAKDGLTDIEIARDYETMIGNPFPLKEMGYSSIIEFMSAHPHIAYVYYKGKLPVYYPLPNAKTDHLRKLVSKQKDSKRDARQTSRRKQAMAANINRVLPKRPTSSVPGRIMQCIVNMMKHFPLGVRLDCFEKKYQQFTGFNLIYKNLGFSTLAELLCAASENIQILKCDGVSVVKLAHKDLSTSASDLKHSSAFNSRSSASSCNQRRTPDLTNRFEGKSNESTAAFSERAGSHIARDFSTTASNFIHESSATTKPLSSVSSGNKRSTLTREQMNIDVCIYRKKRNRCISFNNIEITAYSDFKTVANNILKILDNKQNLRLEALDEKYKKKFRTPLPFRKFDFCCLVEMLQMLSGCIKLTARKEGEIMVELMPGFKDAIFDSSPRTSKDIPKVSSNTRKEFSNSCRFRFRTPHTVSSGVNWAWHNIDRKIPEFSERFVAVSHPNSDAGSNRLSTQAGMTFENKYPSWKPYYANFSATTTSIASSSSMNFVDSTPSYVKSLPMTTYVPAMVYTAVPPHLFASLSGVRPNEIFLMNLLNGTRLPFGSDLNRPRKSSTNVVNKPSVVFNINSGIYCTPCSPASNFSNTSTTEATIVESVPCGSTCRMTNSTETCGTSISDPIKGFVTPLINNSNNVCSEKTDQGLNNCYKVMSRVNESDTKFAYELEELCMRIQKLKFV